MIPNSIAIGFASLLKESRGGRAGSPVARRTTCSRRQDDASPSIHDVARAKLPAPWSSTEHVGDGACQRCEHRRSDRRKDGSKGDPRRIGSSLHHGQRDYEDRGHRPDPQRRHRQPDPDGLPARAARSRPIANSKTRVPTPPQNQAVNAATGRCSCSEPETRSGAKMLISRTATQIPPIPIAVHGIQDKSAVAARRPSRVAWAFGSDIILVTQTSRRARSRPPCPHGPHRALAHRRPPTTSGRRSHPTSRLAASTSGASRLRPAASGRLLAGYPNHSRRSPFTRPVGRARSATRPAVASSLGQGSR